MNDGNRLVRVRCRVCKRSHNYFPSDLIQILGDMEINALHRRMKCEGCNSSSLEVEIISPTGREGVGLRIRRLVAIKIMRVPVWRED